MTYGLYCSAVSDLKSHHLLTIKLFQTYMNFFILLNIKLYILNKVCNQTVSGPHWPSALSLSLSLSLYLLQIIIIVILCSQC